MEVPAPPPPGHDTEELSLHIHMLSGEPIGPPLRTGASELVVALKRLVAAVLTDRRSARSLQLLFEQRILEDTATLQESGLFSGAVLQLVLSAERYYQAVLRCRPATARELQSGHPTPLVMDARRGEAALTLGQGGAEMERALAGSQTEWRIAFDAVYSETCTQEELFRGSVRNLMPRLLEGRSCVVFAYGPARTGKRHALFGDVAAQGGEEGLLPRAFDALAAHIAERRRRGACGAEEGVAVRVSFLQLHNGTASDLLADDLSARLKIRQRPKSDVFVEGLSTWPARSATELRGLLSRGLDAQRRMPERTGRPVGRATLLFTMEVESFDQLRPGSRRGTRVGRLHAVKLVGSQRSNDLVAFNGRYDLNGLERVVYSLAGNRPLIPWRDSMLTRLLQSTLLRSDVLFVMTCSPALADFEDTLSLMRFADWVRRVRSRQEDVVEEGSRREGLEEEDFRSQLWMPDRGSDSRLGDSLATSSGSTTGMATGT